ncbi:MAG TPA: glycoside hydrolase family 97 protein [Bacteroidales bacterium]|nr:glycoside hydrolase family 97 protein [Bacteroidales bacterium]
MSFRVNDMRIGILGFAPLILCFALLFSSCSSDEAVRLDSPDGRNNIVFILREGKPFYRVIRDTRVVIDTSALGFEIQDGLPIGDNLRMEKATMSGEQNRWEPAWGQRNRIREHYGQLQVILKEKTGPGRTVQLEFRAYNDGVAFRYVVPEQEGLAKLEIMKELTEFRFRDDLSAWWIPGDYDNHEFLYRNTPISGIDSANTPLTMESLTDSLCLSLHEAALVNYPEMRLKRSADDPLTLLCDLVPWPDGVKARVEVPFQTPWRTVQLSKTAGELIESSLILNLNEPTKLEDISWIRPMKYIGIWWGMHIGKYTWTAGPKHGATTENAKRHIDFASENNIPGVLVEGWNKGWENWADGVEFPMMEAYDDYNLAEVAGYAKNKGVYLIVHNETGANAEFYETQVDSAFALYERLGVHAIKTGYVGKMRPEGQYHHGQWMVNHQAMIIEKAAKHKIMVDAHETVKATGLERTWPNFMSREWGRGNEYEAWSEGNPPDHTCILPFTRVLAGPFDFTPGITGIYFKDYKPDNRIHTTLAKQLALMVVIYSPLQMAADLIENYEGHPAFRFIREVPVDWDQTKALNGKIGDYVTIARKKNNAWYIGSITDENPRELLVKLDFLDEKVMYEAVVYADGPDADWVSNPLDYVIEKRMVKKDDEYVIRLAPGGGQAITVTPVN